MAIERGDGGWRALVRHDRMIVLRDVRSAFRSWADRLLAIAALLVASVALHAWAADQPDLRAAAAATALCALIGAGAARLVRRRLDFHASDGVLAAHALARPARRDYAIVIHAVVLIVVALAALIIRPLLAAPAALGYLAGAGLGHAATALLSRPRISVRPAIGRRIGAFFDRPAAGIPAAIAALLPGLFPLDTVPLVVLTALAAAIMGLLLTRLDHATIRFMTFSGQGGWRIIGLRARATLILLSIATPIALILSKPIVAGTIGAVALAALAIMAVRVLAYRLHAKRRADTMVSLGIGAVALVGAAAPFLLPVVAAILLWHLQRRSAAATWMLA